MNRLFVIGFIGLVCISVTGTTAGQEVKEVAVPLLDWRAMLARRVQAFGHRNWIVIADSAYPAQASAGIETVLTNADQLQVVKVVLDELVRAKHIRPVVYLDAELAHVSDKDAPGVNTYRQDLKALLAGREPKFLPHERIIDRLDKTAEKFKVLILKTNLTLPYTSVFLELDCGYWSADAEQRLRKAIGTEK
jgi:hypothetical protein